MKEKQYTLSNDFYLDPEVPDGMGFAHGENVSAYVQGDNCLIWSQAPASPIIQVSRKRFEEMVGSGQFVLR